MRKSKITLYWDKFHVGLLAVFIFVFALIYPILYIFGVIYIIRYRKSFHLGFVCTLIGLFFLRHAIWEARTLDQSFHGQVVVTEIHEKTYQDQLTVRHQGIYFHMYTKKDLYEVGQVFIVQGDIKSYKAQTIPKGFDLKTYYLSQNIKGYMDNPSITIIGESFDIYVGRQWVARHIEGYESQGYLSSLFLGNYDLPKETKEIYQSSGLWFLLSFSGIHLYVIVTLIKKGMFYGNVSDGTQRFVIVAFYVFMLYVQRGSWVMWRLIIIHVLSYINVEGYLHTTKFERILMGFLILLFFQIHLIYHLGFLITLCILCMLALFNDRFNRYPPTLKHMLRSYFISCILLGFMASFHMFMFLWMPFFILIFTYVIIPLAVISLCFKPFDAILYKVFNDYERLTEVIYQLIDPIVFPKVSAVVSVLFVCAFLSILMTQSWVRKMIVIMIVFLGFFWSTIEIHLGGGHIIFLDVEQGDSTVVVTPNCLMVIDSYQFVLPYLNAHGLKDIDYLFLTHADHDHIKEAADLIEHLHVRHVIINPYDSYDIAHHSIIKAKQGDHFICGKILIDILGPIRSYQSRNNNSLVLQFQLFNQTFLFTGDIEAEAEADLVTFYGEKLKSDVLKVAHHGSSTSSTEAFINMVQPEIAIISLKLNNQHQFPHQSVIQRLNKHAITIYQTSLTGSITYRIVNKREKWGFNLPF
ncbi:MAG: ComEC/Rec2 family competence protein [Acholeplasmataceae bacterium]